MTLLEVIVALTVAGAALVTGATVLGFLTDQQAQAGSQAIVSANAVRTTIRGWTSSAQLSTAGDAVFRGTTTGREGADDRHDLTFVTTSPTDASPSATQVRIYMKEPSADSATPHGLVAELTPWRSTGTSVTIPLAPDATGFRARYLGDLSNRRNWQHGWISTSVLPAAVELRVLFDSTQTPVSAAHALLAVPMSIPLGVRQ